MENSGVGYSGWGTLLNIGKRIASGLLALGLLAASTWLGGQAFDKVLSFRALERIPLTPVIASTTGEVQLRGKATPVDEPLLSPDTQTPSVYYLYEVEEERTDSDGDKSWHTIETRPRAVNFYLTDESGQAKVLGNPALMEVDWSMPRKFRERRGDLRYTEWRIDINDSVSLFGWLDYVDDEPVVNFHHTGDYLPIVSAYGASEERGTIGWWAIVYLGLSITALVFMCFFLAYSLAIHRILVFVSFIALSCSLLLAHYGWKSLNDDISSGFQRVDNQVQASSRLIQAALGDAGIKLSPDSAFDLRDPRFSGLSATEKQQINGWRLTAWQVRERYRRQINRFPENLFARLTGRNNPSSLPLPPDQLQVARDQSRAFQSTRIGNPLWQILIGLLVTLAAAWLAFRFIRIKRIQENLPSSKPAGVVYGLTEVTGTLVPESTRELLRGPLSDESCVWYHYTVKEKRGSGKNSRWVTLEDRKEKQPFYCQGDDTGIRVFPSNAEVISTHKSRERRGRRIYREFRLMPGDNLYLLGKAVVDKTRGDTLVLRHAKNEPFIVSNKPEKAVMLSKAARGMLLLSAAVSVLFFCLLLLTASQGNFSSLDYLLAALVAPAFLGVLMLIIMFNDLVFLKQRCQRGWANIQVSLKKRRDLVPRLQTVVKQSLKHERELQTLLTEMRRPEQSAESMESARDYLRREQTLLRKIQVTLENYPELKTSSALEDLHKRLVRLENEVAMIRSGFNDAVEYYNTRIQQFPDNLLAGLFRFKRMSLLAFEKAIHQTPRLED